MSVEKAIEALEKASKASNHDADMCLHALAGAKARGGIEIALHHLREQEAEVEPYGSVTATTGSDGQPVLYWPKDDYPLLFSGEYDIWLRARPAQTGGEDGGDREQDSGAVAGRARPSSQAAAMGEGARVSQARAEEVEPSLGREAGAERIAVERADAGDPDGAQAPARGTRSRRTSPPRGRGPARDVADSNHDARAAEPAPAVRSVDVLTPAEPKRHRWSPDGETCLDCGCKDWMGGPCSDPRDRIEPEAEEPMPPRAACFKCNGSALVPVGDSDLYRTMCPHCSGTGIEPAAEERPLCSRCKGVIGQGDTCLHCDDSGREPSPPAGQGEEVMLLWHPKGDYLWLSRGGATGGTVDWNSATPLDLAKAARWQSLGYRIATLDGWVPHDGKPSLLPIGRQVEVRRRDGVAFVGTVDNRGLHHNRRLYGLDLVMWWHHTDAGVEPDEQGIWCHDPDGRSNPLDITHFRLVPDEDEPAEPAVTEARVREIVERARLDVLYDVAASLLAAKSPAAKLLTGRIHKLTKAQQEGESR